MKKTLLALAALSLPLASAAQEVDSLNLVQTINVGGVAIAPQDVAFYNDTIIGTGFSNQVVFRIADPASSPAVTTLINLSGTVTWAPSRGLQDIDVLGTTAYVTGDDGSVGNIFPIDLTNDTLGSNFSTTRGSGLLPLTASSFYFGEAASSTPELIDGTGASTLSGALPPEGFRAPLRDFVLVGSDLFFISSTAPFSIGRFTGVTAGDFGSAVEGFFTAAGGGVRNNLGLATYDDGTTTWLVFPESDGTTGALVFVDSSDSSNVERYAQTELAGRQLTGIAVGELAGTDYIAVTSQNGGAANNEVYLFEIVPVASSVQDWQLLD